MLWILGGGGLDLLGSRGGLEFAEQRDGGLGFTMDADGALTTIHQLKILIHRW